MTLMRESAVMVPIRALGINEKEENRFTCLNKSIRFSVLLIAKKKKVSFTKGFKG
jgi:hypothetical protein